MKRKLTAPLAPLALVAAPFLLAAPADAQDVLQRTGVYGRGDSFLFGVLAGSATGPAIAVLTEPEPAVHRYSPAGNREWGSEGNGPAELESPVDLSWRGPWIHVLDIGNRKVVRYDEEGEFAETRSLGNLWANRLDIVGTDTILGAFTPMVDERAVVRVRGSAVDTLLAYQRVGEDRRLEAPGAPSYTVKQPFSRQVRWAVLADGQLVWYDPATDELVRQDRDGAVVSRTAVAWEGTPVTRDDREWWIANEIPSEFMGRRVFEPLRAVARRELDFPDTFSPVLELEADVTGGVWVQRSLSVAGELWSLVGESGAIEREFRLPPGRELLAVTDSHVFALARDELEVETVETFARPR